MYKWIVLCSKKTIPCIFTKKVIVSKKIRKMSWSKQKCTIYFVNLKEEEEKIIILLFKSFFRREVDSICLWSFGDRSLDTSATQYFTTMYEKYAGKFHKTSSDYKWRLYFCWHRTLGSSGDCCFTIAIRHSTDNTEIPILHALFLLHFCH